MDYFKRCSDFLRLGTRPDSGLTCIITPRWLFLCILTNPYCHAPNGNPVYLDGFDFAGLFSLQTTSLTWPATAGLKDQTITIFDALAESTKVTPIIDDEEEDEKERPASSKMLNNGSMNITAQAASELENDM